jgi:hypothetical protein
MQILCVCVCVRARLGAKMTSDYAERNLERHANLPCSSDTKFICEECQTVYKRQSPWRPCKSTQLHRYTPPQSTNC